METGHGPIFTALVFLLLFFCTAPVVPAAKILQPSSSAEKNPFPQFANFNKPAPSKNRISKPAPAPSVNNVQSIDPDWSNILRALYQGLSTPKIQKNKELYNVRNLGDWGKPGKTQGLVVDESSLPLLIDKLQPLDPPTSKSDVTANLKRGDAPRKIEQANLVIKSVFQPQGDQLCQYNEVDNSVIVQGHSIFLSKVLAPDCLQAGAHTLTILAAHSFFVDGAVVGSAVNSSHNLDVNIFAPNWINEKGDKTVIFDLDGVAGKSYEGETPPRHGAAGKAGRPGGSAGNFVGLGQTFTGGKPVVSAKGGQGGNGQDGGEGAIGQDGEAANVETNINHVVSRSRITGNIEAKTTSPWGCKPGALSCCDRYSSGSNCLCQDWTCFGGPPGPGKSGGGGGKPGFGGVGGTIVFLARDEGLVQRKEADGQPGSQGFGGAGGRGGRRGQQVTFRYDKTSSPNSKSYDITNVKQWMMGTYGPDGEKGCSGCEGTPENPAAAQKFYVKYIPVFDAFARQKVAENPALFQQIGAQVKLIASKAPAKQKPRAATSAATSVSSLLDLMTKIDQSSDLHLLRHPLSLFVDLKLMEIQWPSLANQKEVMLQAYQSLLGHVLEVARNTGKTKQNQGYLQALQYLYTAAYSRVASQSTGLESYLVTDMLDYVQNALSSFENLQKSVGDRKKLKMIQDTKASYSQMIQAKLGEANDFIKNVLVPEIERTQDGLDKVADGLLKEIAALRDQGGKKVKELEEKKKQLQRHQKLQLIFDGLKLTSNILSCIGPAGSLAGSLIGGVSGVAEAAMLKGVQGMDLAMKVPDAIMADQKAFVTYFTAKKTEYSAIAVEQLEKVNQALGQPAKPKDPTVAQKLKDAFASIQSLTDQIKSSQREINKIKGDTVGSDIEWNIDAFGSLSKVQELDEAQKAKLTSAIEAQQVLIEKKKESEAKYGTAQSQQALEVLNTMGTALSQGKAILTLGTDMYSKYKKDQKAIEDMADSIVKAKKEVDKTREKLVSVEYDMKKGLEKMRVDMAATLDSLKTKSPVALEVSKWQISKQLGEMQSLFSQTFTGGFASDNALKKCFDTMSLALTTLLKVYDRMNEYESQAKLANFIAQINAVEFASPNTDPALGQAVSDVQLVIQANVIRQQYELSLKSFKMYQFPFVIYFLQELTVPEEIQKLGALGLADDATFFTNNLGVGTTTDTFVDKILTGATNGLKLLYSDIQKDKNSIIPTDSFTRVRVPYDEGADSTGPFYTWTNIEHADDIRRMLRQEPVALKADVGTKDHEDEDGIKFNKVELRFTSNDTTMMTRLTEKLKGYKITLTHSGQNYYRNGRDVYMTMVEKFPLVFNFEKRSGDKYNVGAPNKVYSKILDAPPCLSPYTMWLIHLEKIRKGTGTEFELEEFASSIDVQLVGEGSVVNEKDTSEKLQLDRFYERVEL